MADCYILLGIWGAIPPKEVMPKGKEAATRALQVDENLAEARVSLAFVKWTYDWDWTGADEDFKTALKLNPNYSTAHHWRAYFLAAQEKFNEAAEHIKRAQEIEGPLALSINADIGEIFCWSRQYEKAAEHLQEVIKIEPNFAVARNNLGIVFIKQKKFKEAVAETENAARLDKSPRMPSSFGYAYGISGENEKARQIIAELKELSTRRYVSPFAVAVVHIGLNEKEEALDWLEKAFDERSDAIVILKVYPWLDELRDNPRFQKLQERVGIKP